jgi:hypothetical protein
VFFNEDLKRKKTKLTLTLIDNGDGTTNVAVMNPVTALSIVGNDKIIPFADEVKVLLEKALNSL